MKSDEQLLREAEALDAAYTGAAEFDQAHHIDYSECQNCGEVWPDSELQPIEDIFQRVAPGEPMPSGECPDCGALCQPAAAEDPDGELRRAALDHRGQP